MSIIISGIKLPYGNENQDAVTEALKIIKASRSLLKDWEIHKLSYDLRHNNLTKVYSVELDLDLDEAGLIRGLDNPMIKLRSHVCMPIPIGSAKLMSAPIIIGLGPAGLFAALILAKNGYAPIVFERGEEIERRDSSVDRFFSGGDLDFSSNVQFGEGGAGTYSDGKLTTRINDERCQLVLNLLSEYGAEKQMLMKAKPHIGTDKLKGIVKAMREDICKMGGTVYFSSQITDINTSSGKLISVSDACGTIHPTQTAILAIGHSARDTFYMLKDKGVDIIPKAFSVGVRAEHLQSDIDVALYGKFAGISDLPKGEYTLSLREGGRACYSFCMCPGGYVVAAASEKEAVVTNGMSYHARSGSNANSAICVSVTPEDFSTRDPLSGVEFQRKIEHAAFMSVGGRDKGPVQLYGDFAKGQISKKLGKVAPTYPRGYEFADISKILPDYVCDMIKRAMPAFGKKISGFDREDTVFTAPETRTSSPIRIVRGEDMMSASVRGLIPCGEGAGYAGGIMSAAVDGIRAAERIMAQYAPMR
ncbi:MAG: hypothetical protein VB078_06705 [Clostridiaceae bacterium]|nr:hypothetical protein [Clostridiaceae bacterium]